MLLLLLADRAVAQERAGGLEGFPPLELEASVTAGSEYTDNFFRSKTRPQSNFRHTLTPDLALKLTGPQLRAGLRYRPTGSYSTLVEEVEHFHALDADAAYEATPFFTLRATEQFLRSDNPAITDPNTLQVRRTTTTRNTAALELPYRTETWSLVPRGSWATSENESDRPLSDERSTVLTGGGDGGLTLVPFNIALRAGAETTRGQFRLGDDFSGQTYRGGLTRPFGPNFDLNLDGVLTFRQPDRGDEFRIRDVAASARYQPLETVSLSGRVGYQDTDVGTAAGTQGLTYSTQASYSRAAFTVVSSSALSIQETFTETENVGVVRSTNAGVSVTYPATDDLLLSGAVRWNVNEFLESATDREDTTLTWSLSARYQLTRTMTVTAAWDRTTRESTPTTTTSGFSANTYRFELSINFR